MARSRPFARWDPFDLHARNHDNAGIAGGAPTREAQPIVSIFSILALVAVAVLLGVFWARKLSIVLGLVFANLAVYVISVIPADTVLSIAGSPLLTDLAFRPRYLAEADWSRAHTVLTSAFLHANFPHLIGNMLILVLAGIPFEDRMGRGRFLGVYTFGAVSAVLLHIVWMNFAFGTSSLNVPVVGASGAVFGVLGGFAATYPRDRIPMPLGFILLPRVPVVLGTAVLAFLEIMLLFGAPTGVAHAAHIGGIVGGTVAAPLLRPPLRRPGESEAGLDLDYDALERLARDERTQSLVRRVRENSDRAELQRAWLDRLLVHLRCPQCGDPYAEPKPGVLECTRGHRETYRA